MIPDHLCLINLPTYPPKLNPMEHIRGGLRENAFHNQVSNRFDSLKGYLKKAFSIWHRINLVSVPWSLGLGS
jgi:hypothetical protein